MPRVAPPDLAAFLLDTLTRAPAECWLMGEAWDRAVAERRQRHEDKPDPKRRLAEFLAGEMLGAGMAIDYEVPELPRSPLPWSGNR